MIYNKNPDFVKSFFHHNDLSFLQKHLNNADKSNLMNITNDYIIIEI